MKFQRLWILLLFLSCTSNTVDLTIQIGADQTGNPLLDVQDGLDALPSPTNTGLYFAFREMVCPPPAISSTVIGPAPIYYPDKLTTGGWSPTQSSYTIPTSIL